jgi:REP element-mobilizing transposase RayT
MRLRGYDYTRVGVYAVTICTHPRRTLFGDVSHGEMHCNELGQLVHATWETLPTLYPHIVLDEFIVMPDHVHAIIALVGFIFPQLVASSEFDHPIVKSDAPQIDSVGARFIAPAGKRRIATGVMNHAPTGSHHDVTRFNFTENPARSPKIERAPAGSLGEVVRGFKARATRAINRHRDTMGSSVWQRDYYDDIIRDDIHLRNARRYVRDNPRRWKSRR